MNPATTGYRIDPYDLRLFAAVVEAGTITAGAQRMHLSLAAASTRLQQLEHALGTQLLHRAKRGVTLTDAGRTLLRHAGRLQREMDALHGEMAAHAHGVRSTVRVLCNTAAMTEYLPPLIGPFLARHPEVDIELRELASQDALLAMRQESADLAVVADHVDTTGLHTRPFRADPLVAVLPPGGSRKGRGAVPDAPGPRQRLRLRFADLLSQPFVGLPAESGLSRHLHAQALTHGRGLHHRVRVGGLEVVLRLVAQGVGVAVLPQATARRFLAGLAPGAPRPRVRPLADGWTRRQLLLCSAEPAGLGRAAGLLLETLAQQP